MQNLKKSMLYAKTLVSHTFSNYQTVIYSEENHSTSLHAMISSMTSYTSQDVEKNIDNDRLLDRSLNDDP